MARHIVFFVHGIGQHDTAWAEGPAGPVETLADLSAQYAWFESRPLGSLVEAVPIRYDHVFTAAVEQWRDEASGVSELDPGGVLGAIVDTLADATDESVWWSHVADLVMYRTLRAYRQRVRTDVIRQIAERVEAAWEADGAATCSVIAHSLGTAVAHDCLHLLGTQQWGGAGSPFSPAHWRFQHVIMLANTSRLLQTPDGEVAAAYESIVRPGPVEDPASYCGTYLNVRHELDPVAFPRRFDPVGWRPQYLALSVNHYWNSNIHGFSHHLQNPRVHVPILRKLTKRSAITGEEEIEAVAGFPRFARPAASGPGAAHAVALEGSLLDRAHEHLVQLQGLMLEVGDDPTPKELARMLLRACALVRQYSA